MTTCHHNRRLQNTKFTKVPPEVFIKICRNLRPKDLFSLEKVCRIFRDYLVSNDSPSTQMIWRDARLTFCKCYKLGPPGLMLERDYLKFMIEDKCQFCESEFGMPRFEFMIKCCFSCYNLRVVRKPDFKQIIGDIPNDVFSILPWRYNRQSICTVYFIPQVKKILLEYNALANAADRKSFCLYQAAQSQLNMANVDERHDEWMNQFNLDMLEAELEEQRREEEVKQRRQDAEKMKRERQQTRRTAVQEHVKKMMEEVDRYGNQKWDRSWLLSNCQAIKKAKDGFSTHEFTARSWKDLRKKIEKEYREYLKDQV